MNPPRAMFRMQAVSAMCRLHLSSRTISRMERDRISRQQHRISGVLLSRSDQPFDPQCESESAGYRGYVHGPAFDGDSGVCNERSDPRCAGEVHPNSGQFQHKLAALLDMVEPHRVGEQANMARSVWDQLRFRFSVCRPREVASVWRSAVN